ncbi:MAG: hypothetical protein J0J10_15630 [Bosea sp.]|uniref:hypothetical protein n=1 Tax=Bosea sp. (in: a-proteobacteria) TaxID=1871050 RepID=UPI001AD2F7AA|nr:hypothetical protein [Bosea sp. (in: a-proteobacteria)]MBN9470194.1 hypothetical protein [Bosea sp. (in: a-proteobacteria)]
MLRMTLTAVGIVIAQPAISQSGSRCILTHEKVENVYQGSAPSSIEYALGCSLRKVSTSGFGESASSVYEVTDARGSTFTAIMNSAGRLRTYNFYMR